MSTVTVTVKTNKSFTEYCKPRNAHRNQVNLINLLSGMVVGALIGEVYVNGSATDPLAASGTFTLASAADTNTAVIGGITLTAKTSPAGNSQFLRGVSDTADAAAMVACVNAHPTLSKVVTATSALGVVTITVNQKGLVGNLIATTATGNITAGAATLASGTGGTNAADVKVR